MIKLLELFGGIGACSKAFEKLKIDYKIIDYVEIDKYAVMSFNALHNTNFEPQNICQWNKDIKVDLIMHGSPCQDFSIAGVQKGGDINSNTKSSLMYETLRIIKKLKPQYVIWENVPNLISKKHIHNFNNYLKSMESLGYFNYYKILNSMDYNIPQNRKRLFTVSILKNNVFVFPNKQKLTIRLDNLLENKVDDKYILSNDIENDIIVLKSKQKQLINLIKKTKLKKGQVLNLDLYNQKVNDIYSQTLTLPNHNSQRIFDGHVIRKLTPRESWRLMGFDDEDFNKVSQLCSDTQLYKQAGNSIVVNVLVEIIKNLIKEGD